jgi:endonuclease III related protein
VEQEQLQIHISTLFAHYGPQNWWPGKSQLEVVVGAVLVQNTAWKNVEHALRNLSRAKALSLSGLRALTTLELERLIRPAGFFRQKAATLERIVGFLDTRHRGSVGRLLSQRTDVARAQLLSIRGIGPETADSILLYAGGHPIFVVDAYTRRIFGRHALARDVNRLPYDRLRTEIEIAARSIPKLVPAGEIAPAHPDSVMSRRRAEDLAERYKELHAMIVRVGSVYCRRAPDCHQCPLRDLVPRPPLGSSSNPTFWIGPVGTDRIE